MVESFKEIPFDEAKGAEDVDKLLQQHLNVSLNQCGEALGASLQERADELAEELTSVAPHGDYDKLMDEPAAIAQFLREDASKAEHWTLEFLEYKKEKDQLIELVFSNKAVDDGDNLKGFVFIGLSGKIRHAFPQVH